MASTAHADPINQLLQNRGAFRGRGDAHHQGQALVRLILADVGVPLGIVEFLVNPRPNLLQPGPVPVDFVRAAQCRGGLFEQFPQIDAVVIVKDLVETRR